MSFKVGDKVIITNNTHGYSITTNGSIGIVIKDFFNGMVLVNFKSFGDKSNWRLGKITEWDIYIEDLKLYREELKSEVDYLNAFKDNFKDGV